MSVIRNTSAVFGVAVTDLELRPGTFSIADAVALARP